MNTLIEPNLVRWRKTFPPASDAEIDRLVAAVQFALPTGLIEMLKVSNGGEGWLAIRPWYFQLWSSVEIPAHNIGYETEKYFSEYIGFGSSGGGSMFAFHKDSASMVFGIPYDTIDHKDIDVIAESLELFAVAMGVEAQPGVQADRP